ncbi:hypothetical protein CGZ80_25300 [Rhodopirellula sp. MGV]|nr:hypothetical protein CGZ80_25300 [Rhodopirellula sp. MGV]PNY36995.1 hypothetical protein C2E31_10310 [Rhodopirellula baltica]
MIAPLEKPTPSSQRLANRPVYDGSEHLPGPSNGRVAQVVTNHPKASMLVALASGALIGWVVKRSMK